MACNSGKYDQRLGRGFAQQPFKQQSKKVKCCDTTAEVGLISYSYFNLPTT
jgi:hypothetical protein